MQSLLKGRRAAALKGSQCQSSVLNLVSAAEPCWCLNCPPFISWIIVTMRQDSSSKLPENNQLWKASPFIKSHGKEHHLWLWSKEYEIITNQWLENNSNLWNSPVLWLESIKPSCSIILQRLESQWLGHTRAYSTFLFSKDVLLPSPGRWIWNLHQHVSHSL